MLKIYLATGAREYLMLLLMCGVKQILVSYEYPEPYACKKLLERHGIKIMVDSGAFSAWSKGRIINLDEYIEFIKDNKSVIDPERIVNLDIIMGGAKKASIEEHEEACRKGFENYYYMKEKLSNVFDKPVDPIHVFHQGDNFKWLEKMLKECTTIGISPNNDFSDDMKEGWLKDCFRMIGKLNRNIKTHAFGVTSDRLLSKFPYTTADSSSWALTSAFGSILTPFGRFIVSDEAIDKQEKEIKETQDNLSTEQFGEKYIPLKTGHIDKNLSIVVNEQLKNYLSEFGFTLESLTKKYKYRNIVNIFFFIWLQDKINANPPSFDDSFIRNEQMELLKNQGVSPEKAEELKEKILENNVL